MDGEEVFEKEAATAATKENCGKNVVYLSLPRRPPYKRLIEIDILFQTLHLGFVCVCCLFTLVAATVCTALSKYKKWQLVYLTP